jgi:hypothetical protein
MQVQVSRVVSTFSCSLHLKISSATLVSCFKNLVVLRKCLKTFFGRSIDAAQSLKSKFKLFTKFLFVFLFRQKNFRRCKNLLRRNILLNWRHLQ